MTSISQRANDLPAGPRLVVGLGISGRAIARFLRARGEAFVMADTRSAPPGLEAFRADFPEVTLHLGALDTLDLDAFAEIAVSPGVDTVSAGLSPYRHKLVGEIGLFRRYCHAPLVAITGSNAKSTVTTLVGEMAQEAGLDIAVGGNLGEAALDLLLDRPAAAWFVLELSSFQLESLDALDARCAAFLNLSEDHLDRHGDMAGYRAAKARIFRGAECAVVNAEDRATWPDDPQLPCVRFTRAAPVSANEWGVAVPTGAEEPWLCRGTEGLMPVAALAMAGRHNQANALAAAAIGEAMGLPWTAMRQVLTRFGGLPHRGEVVVERRGVRWINDSKGTNVGATLAAIAGVGEGLAGRLVWLGGGVGKGADFTPLVPALARHAREAVVFGQDAGRLAAALGEQLPVTRVETLAEAMRRAAAIAEPGDCVLLSPACASLDQFPNYLARGAAFREILAQGQEATC